MRQDKLPTTRAIHTLREHGVNFTRHPYPYIDRGGTSVSAKSLGVDEHAVIKTIIMEDDAKSPMIVLMHGDCEVSAKNLARNLGVKGINSCTPAVAERHTGYQVGGTSPLGTKRAMPVYMQQSIVTLPYLYINGGRRGYLVGMTPEDLVRVLKPTLVEVATPSSSR